MNFHPAAAGKTAPKLFQDFLAFDPIRGKPNILVEHSPPHGEGPQLAASIGSCKHEYTTKFSQSALPPLDLRPDGNTLYKIAVVCKKCRIHADIRVDHSNSTSPCPTSDHPLHHFQRVASYDVVTEDRIRYVWQCSVEECRATLFISFRRPRLHEEDVNLLINPELLKRRYDALLKEDPKREGIRVATQMESLQRLRKYVKDSLNPQHNKRQFPSNNKRFQEAFGIDGQECSELLEHLGFKYNDHTWTLPNPEQIHDCLQSDGNSQRELLEDVEIELLACMCKLSTEQALVNPAAEEGWSSANRDIERTLAAQGYTRHVPHRRGPASNAELPFFNSLGALLDFSDYLVEYAYDRQTLCDPERQPYYFECLQEITDSRNTEQLQMKVATLQSQDIVSRRDISAAYRYFNIPLSEAKNIEDHRILELFQAQQPDLGPAAQEEARGHLYKIGVSRQSSLLLNASRQSVDTYEDALAWLGNGVNKDTADEGILAVLAIRTADSQTNEEIGKKAISVIARARQSNSLNNWLTTGRTDNYTMSVDEALRHLNIEQSLDSLDHSILPAAFEIAKQDRPGETTNRAIATIQQALSTQRGITAMHAPEIWPVGLLSHGNTCYLNSLLQYYFSIKPLRDIILNYDDYRLDTSAHQEKEERVGQRKVSLIEIEGGQRFAEDLKHLFERMIKSPSMSVRPEEDLVCRAFLDPQQYKLLDASLQDERNGDLDQAMANGVADATEGTLTDGQILDSPIETIPVEQQSSEASSTTLQASTNGEDIDVTMQNVDLLPTPPGSPPRLKGGGQMNSSMAPPLPPRRRFSTAKEKALDIAQQKARQQQDVTEVHDGAMFRLRCGMQPKGCDSGGEQIDALRDLFSILIEETIVNKGVEQKPKVMADSNIQLNVPYEATDIYSALDAVFDLQPYGDDSGMEMFKSIRALPPVLEINIPRIGYSTGGAFKANECVRLEDELYLDRYYNSSQPDILAKRRKCWGWRKRLQTLKMEQRIISKTDIDLDGPSLLAQTAAYLTSLDEVNGDLQSIGVEAIEADGAITAALSAEAEKQAAVVAALDSEIDILQKKLDDEFADRKSVMYRLAAVFFHRGQHGHGHYWIYIHDFEKNIWRSYNDERVEEFERVNEIFEAKTFQHGTPTYAVYVASDKLDMVQPVCRDPEKAPTPEELPALQFSDDVEMANAKSQKDSASTINPRLIVEGGNNEWDPPRQVADETNCVRGNENRRVRFAGSRIFDRECASFLHGLATSPGKRHGPSVPVSPPKTQKLDAGGARASKFMEMLVWDGNDSSSDPGFESDVIVSSVESSPVSENSDKDSAERVEIKES